MFSKIEQRKEHLEPGERVAAVARESITTIVLFTIVTAIVAAFSVILALIPLCYTISLVVARHQTQLIATNKRIITFDQPCQVKPTSWFSYKNKSALLIRQSAVDKFLSRGHIVFIDQDGGEHDLGCFDNPNALWETIECRAPYRPFSPMALVYAVLIFMVLVVVLANNSNIAEAKSIDPVEAIEK